MSLQVIEGTWEEIKRREAELIGHFLRVTIQPDAPPAQAQSTSKKSTDAAKPKVLTGFGAFKGKVGSSEEFAREKRAEIEWEERNL